MKIAWLHKLLGKHSKKFYGILAGILTAAVAGSGVGYHVIAASGTADQTEEDTQIDETDGQEDGSFSGTGTTQVKTESQLPDFSVNAVTMTVEEVYVEAGSTVAEGDALFKIDDESMADAKAYYEDAISDAETALQSAKIDFESGVLEAESELSSTKLAADTAQDTYDAAVSELSVKTSEAQEAYDEAVEELSDYQDAIDNGTYYTQVGINEKQSAVDAAQAALTEKQTQLSDAQSSSQAAKDLLAALPADLAPERRAVVQTACQLVGKVRYFWGGKSLKIGWDDRWGTLRQVTAAGSSTTGTYRPFGMDCSGFADWVFYNTSGGEYVIGHGGGAHAQHTYCTPISWEEALPGDLVFYPGDEHVGIVGGRDEAGDLLIVHCASNANNVVITGKSGFTSIGRPVYYRE